ncbi:MAG: capsular polysaccharide biosynthesis protein [Granulosicoccus sp.]
MSSGLRRLRHLHRFLELDRVVSPSQIGAARVEPVCVLVWGRKANSERALAFAAHQQLPVWYLEDGWIRNCDEDAHSRKTYSLLVDKSGVYYDSSQPSDLEAYLNLSSPDFAAYCTNEQLERARCLRERLVQHEISKYNYCRSVSVETFRNLTDRPLVLVIDQTRNDASVLLGGMNDLDFQRMLDAAIRENPDAHVVVRTHPDVLAGRREGYLTEYAKRRGVRIHGQVDNPISWLKRATRVYTGTSQTGYEALLCGCHVTVFGKPFYAGWGLTDDRSQLPARRQRRTIDELFYACHLSLARYVNPVDGSCWSLDQCIEHVAEQKRQFERNAQRFCCIHITPWKRRYLEQYLKSPDGDVRFASAHASVPGEQLLTWSYRDQKRSRGLDAAKLCYRVEDGFIRSNGLGSDYTAPSSLVIDSSTLYFDRHLPSDLENLLNSYTCSTDQIERAKRLRQLIVESRISKYNLPVTADNLITPDRSNKGSARRLLVVGQVEDDESIIRGSGEIRTNEMLLEVVRQENPDSHILYKPHPDVESGNRRGSVGKGVLKSCVNDVLLQQPIEHCLQFCNELHTMTSLTGFEALIRGIKVVAHGMPFYAGWGLTRDSFRCDRRNRNLTIDELVYLTLIEYPRYLHLPSGEFISPEMQVQLIREDSEQLQSRAHSVRWFHKMKNIGKALRYVA